MATRDQLIGLGVLLGSVAGIIAYFYLIFPSPWSISAIQLTVFIAVAGVLGILVRIGYRLATAPLPKPVEKVERKLKRGLKTPFFKNFKAISK